MKASFNITELKANILPYRISFKGNFCQPINSSDVQAIIGDQISITSPLDDCGIQAFTEGDKIVFEQTIVVEYGTNDKHNLIYRYFNDSYDVKCYMDRNVTQKLDISVKERKTISSQINQTTSFDFDFDVSKASTNETVNGGLVSIGEKLRFDLKIKTNMTSIKTSPENCYATRLDGTGQYFLIQEKCENPDDSSVKILTPSNSTHSFSWEMLAFRYFGNSDGVVIKCQILICEDDGSLFGECDRCNHDGGGGVIFRKRREIKDKVQPKLSVITSRPIFIVDASTFKGSQSGDDKPIDKTTEESMLSTPGGIILVSVIGIVAISVIVIFAKKMFIMSQVTSLAAKTAEMGVNNSGIEA